MATFYPFLLGRLDATGLWAFPALLGGKALALAIGGTGTWGAAKVADNVKSFFTGKDSHAAEDAATRVSPMVAGTVVGSTLAAASKAAMIQRAPVAATLIGQMGSASGKAAIDVYRKNEATILEGLGFGKDVLSGYGMPLSASKTLSEMGGVIATRYGEDAKGIVKHTLQGIHGKWDEAQHPRNPENGEFINK